jgi:hypothetical protein
LRALRAGSAVFALTPRAMGSTPLRGADVGIQLDVHVSRREFP